MILYAAPKFKEEFENLANIEQFKYLSMQQWVIVASKGRAVKWDAIFTPVSLKHAQEIFALQPPEKQDKFESLYKTGLIEMPIVYSYRNKNDIKLYEILGGRLRAQGMLAKGEVPYLWLIDNC